MRPETQTFITKAVLFIANAKPHAALASLHRVARIDHQIEQRHFKALPVYDDRPACRIDVDLAGDVRAHRMTDKRRDILHKFDRFGTRGPQFLASGKSHELAYEAGGAL